MEVFLEVSNLCDMKCAMCPTFSELSPHRLFSIKEQERGFIDTERLLESLDEVLQRALIVHCFGYGEPTLHQGFAALLGQLEPYRVLVDFFTNGMHLDQSFCELLVGHQVSAVTLSFSGVERADYENLYLGGRFDTVLAGLRRLSDCKRRAGSQYPRIEINSLGFDHHVARLPAFVDLMADQGAEVIHLKALQTYDVTKELRGHRSVPRTWVEGPILEEAERRAKERGLILSCEQYWATRVTNQNDWRERLGDRSHSVPLGDLPAYAAARVPVTPPPGFLAQPQPNALELAEEAAVELMDFSPYEGDEPFYCFEPFKTLYVRRSGHLKPCCFADDSGPALGALTEGSATAAWRGAPWRHLRQGILAQRYPRALCGACLKHRIGPRRHDLHGQLAAYSRWLDTVWQLRLDHLQLPEQSLDNTEIVERARARSDYHDWLDEVRRLQPFGVPAALLNGHLDGVRDGQLHGWLWAPERPRLRLAVAIFCDGEPWARVQADRQRDDLAEAGIGDGGYGFALDCASLPAAVERIDVYLADTHWLLGAVDWTAAAGSDTAAGDVQQDRIIPPAPAPARAQPSFCLDYGPGIHEQEILKFFAERAARRPPPRQPDADECRLPVLIIAFSNRSGSNLLAEALAATELVHNAGECFNFSAVQNRCVRDGILDLPGYLKSLRSGCRTDESTLAVKLSWDQLFFLTKVGVIPHYWRQTRFVWSLRDDLLAQALSAAVAERTQCWASPYPGPRVLGPVLDAITPAELGAKVQQIAHAQSQFHSYFALHGVTPALIEYQDLAADPEAEVRRVLTELGLIPSGWRWRFDPERIRVRQQRTDQMERRLRQVREALRH